VVSSFINPVVSPDAKLGVSGFDDTAPIRLWQSRSQSEVDLVIRAVYRQVLGNAYVMESERLVVPESQLQRGEISVREFVRQIAQSDFYRARFSETCSRMRSIELNFKHLLGRAPESYEEMTEHSQLLDQIGFEAEISSYVDSDEYQQAFGEDTVPYYRGYKTQTGKKMVGFTHLLSLLRGTASSDKVSSQDRSRLNSNLMRNRPSSISPVVGATSTWQRPATVTDYNQIIEKALGLKAQAPDRTFTQPVKPTTLTSGKFDRQTQFYQAYQPFKETEPVELSPGFSDSEAEVVIRTAYRQILGNAHVMESERLTVAESQLKHGELSVREFVRQLAKSELYRSRFFDNCYRYRSIELNFKHLLGRAPDNFDQMRDHSAVLDREGFEADIDTYLDSDEYQTAFGEHTVPYYRGYLTQPGQSLLEFTNMFQLLRSASSSDKDLATNNKPQLTRALIQNSPYGQLKTRDVSEILAEVFRPKYVQSSQSSVSDILSGLFQPHSGSSPATQAMQQELQEQKLAIAALKQKLSDLRPFASVGANLIKSDWQPSLPAVSDETVGSFQQQIDAQVAEIAGLQAQVADARRYASVGEARLNKWRSRVFNS